MGGYIILDDYGLYMVGFMFMDDFDVVFKMFCNELGDIEEGDDGMKIILMV